ncbi:porin [Caenimonas sp. SL110]|uniref:porin n=1 Tax=Caenimonas sp. SL110 TaxID=1450524 RepID=UPI0006535B64|nr:porin [Caenimonas sp. SL110]
MKKSLIALAVLAAAAGSASAQSSVTLFGIVDATLAFGRGSVSNKTQLTNSGYNSSRLGFRGTEDLGGGMSASFWLEAGLTNDNGTGAGSNSNNQAGGAAAANAGGQGLTFNRRSTVSLAGGWGELRLGRDYTPQFWNLTVFDPFGTNGVGTTQTLNSIITGVTAVRASNSIGYFLPGNLGGFYGQLQHYRGENNSGAVTSGDGTGTGVRLGYAAGPLNVALALSRTDYAAGDVRQSNIGAQYDFGVGKVMAHISRDQNGALDGRGWLLGGLFPVGAGEIRAAYSRYSTDAAGSPSSRKLALGYVHNLSKRTALYTTYARVKNSGGAAAALNGSVTTVNGSSSGYDFGIRHAF